MKLYSFLATAALWGASMVDAASSPQGCFSSDLGLTFNGTNMYNSIGACGQTCLSQNFATFAMNSSYCYCGELLPPADTKVDNSQCTISCPGYPSDICGGKGYYSVYLTGLTTSAENADPTTSTTASPTQKPTGTSSATPSVVTVGGQTVVVTANPGVASDPVSSPSAGSRGSSKAGVAAGVVVGLIVFAALAAGLFVFFRNKKRREIEEEHRQAAAVNNFIEGGKSPISPNSRSVNDMRLDPAVMASRRMSDGSIADNQDYSRRILKVTNA